ncbi:hypothetical protein OHA37_18500 [Streptomyces sp. NBC_00335]|uniref:SCO4225 family membrane protein n=1 Tax=unclassified Streptomyces TaxID=2593676 RepID=UPI0022555CBE|nr:MULTISPECIES: hypothetical protein [unclassified Streptomyces]MCX5405873.1 hypothetical protein [Streptomyces sp. NBC_00086]
MPGAYLALVVAMLVYLAVGSRTGDVGMFGALPILATAPVSMLLLSSFGPAADALEAAPPVDPHPYTGSEPPTKLPTDYPWFASDAEPLPADYVPDTSVDSKLDMGGEFGLYGAVLVSALINATAIWALLRYAARSYVAKCAPA